MSYPAHAAAAAASSTAPYMDAAAASTFSSSAAVAAAAAAQVIIFLKKRHKFVSSTYFWKWLLKVITICQYLSISFFKKSPLQADQSSVYSASASMYSHPHHPAHSSINQTAAAAAAMNPYAASSSLLASQVKMMINSQLRKMMRQVSINHEKKNCEIWYWMQRLLLILVT